MNAGDGCPVDWCARDGLKNKGEGAEVSDGGPVCSKQGAQQTTGLQMYSVLLIAFNPPDSHGFF